MPVITPNSKLLYQGQEVQRIYQGGVLRYQKPPTKYIVDRIQGTTAYLYPYADRAESPRVAGKVRTVPAQSIATTYRTNLASNESSNFQLVDSKSAGIAEMTITRTDSSAGAFFYYRSVDNRNRYEVNFSSTGFVRFTKRTNNSNSIIYTTPSGIAVGQQVKVTVRVEGDELLWTVNDDYANTYNYTATGSFETATECSTTGVQQKDLFAIYPLVVTL